MFKSFVSNKNLWLILNRRYTPRCVSSQHCKYFTSALVRPRLQCIFTKQSITAALTSCQCEGLGNTFNEKHIFVLTLEDTRKTLLLKVISNQKVMTFDAVHQKAIIYFGEC